ncbi:MAG TPA: hypothetical protein VFF11_01100, partial [Candidatus Binatia bacterium]|nr:hypothetical protein [Candidatus Binatia bacterium]
LKVTHNDLEREGVLIHLARTKILAGMFDQAQATLDTITNAAYTDLKRRLERSLEFHKNPPPEDEPDISTNPAASTNTNAPATGK